LSYFTAIHFLLTNKRTEMKTIRHFGFLFLFLLPVLVAAQTEPVDLEMIHKIKQEGLRNSMIEDLSFWMTDALGSRLPGSTGMKRATEMAKQKMEEIGLTNVALETWGEFGKGWDNTKCYIAMTAPYYSPIIATPKAWTAGTDGLLKSEVILVDIQDADDFEGYKGMLRGKIVTSSMVTEIPPEFEPLARRMTDEDLERISSVAAQGDRRRFNEADFARYRQMRQLRNQMSTFFEEEGAAAILTPSGSFGTIRSSGASATAEEPAMTEMLITAEHHGRIVRLLQHDIPVEVEMEVTNIFHGENLNDYNVIGEIPGTDKNLKDQVVMVGGHLDCWHGGTGANDNASGCIVMMEALRILKAIGVKPRRTIRIALWGAEEQGLYGSRGYVSKHFADRATMETKPEHAKLSAYYNIDNGSGKVRGIYMQENDMLRPIFEAWLKPFEDMGASTVTNRNTSGTDHLSFNSVGLPGFQFIQDPINYGRGYHTNMDTYERLMLDDMKQTAIIVASFVYHTAMRDELLPRKPLPEPQGRSDRRF